MPEKEKKYLSERRVGGFVPAYRGIITTVVVVAEWNKCGYPAGWVKKEGKTVSLVQRSIQGTERFIASMDHAFSDFNQFKGTGFHFNPYPAAPFLP